MVTRTSYHHGALRDALLAACLRLIETEGIAAVSLRRVAREAGVSTAAPYHHFPDRAALLATLSTQGYQLLAVRLAAARAEATTPMGALTALARSYFRFSREQPAYFRLMFRPELSQPDKHPAAMAAGDAAFAVLTDAIAECVRAGVLPADKADTLAVMYWGLSHGLASLRLDGQLEKRAEQFGTTTSDLADDVMRTFAILIEPGAPPLT
ncbi:TetR/AcrR family transcriptional regulator [Nocardia sp. NPDC051787]|uniref:TetR/AcrR family transcriptional regulator n=1 Tax=Nocardia sp. NPDC051787 TaxID=3155415 RepID=UPI00341885EA